MMMVDVVSLVKYLSIIWVGGQCLMFNWVFPKVTFNGVVMVFHMGTQWDIIPALTFFSRSIFYISPV